MSFLVNQLYQLLVMMYEILPNLGLVIILFTLLIRGLIFAFSFKSLKASQHRMGKMQEMQKELGELKKKYKDDPATLQAKQMELTKRYNINPLAGCIPQLLQIFVFILFYQALVKLVGVTEINGAPMNSWFLIWNLGVSDPYHIIPIFAAVTQFLLSFMITPGAQIRDIIPNNSKKKEIQKANEKEEDSAEMAATMQRQMMFMMPIMTGFIAWSLPAGMGLYWIVSTIFGIGQQVALSGWGALAFWKKKEVVVETEEQKSKQRKKDKTEAVEGVVEK